MKFLRLVTTTLLIVPFVLLTGCAAMFTGTSSDVRIDARPAGGYVILDDERHELPTTLDVSKKTELILFEHPEYGEQLVELDRDLMGGYVLLDLLFTPGFGLVGLLVDGTTSAWMELPTHMDHDFETYVPPDAVLEEE